MAMTRLLGRAVAIAMVCASVGLLVRAQEASVPDTVKLQQMAARFAPTEIGGDLSSLSPSDRQVLAKLIAASKIIDGLFLRQVWAGKRRDAPRSGRRPHDSRPRAASSLPHQQRSVVAARS